MFTPSTHGDIWTKEVWSKEVLRTRNPLLVMKSRVLNKDREMLEGGQILNIMEVGTLPVTDVKADGTFDTSSPFNANRTLTIDAFRTAGFSIRDDFSVQTVMDCQAKFSEEIGKALARDMEVKILRLEQGIAAGNRNSVTGDFTDLAFRGIIAQMDAVEGFPTDDRHALFSAGQKAAIMAIDKYNKANELALQKSEVMVRTGKLLAEMYGVEMLWTPLMTAANGIRRTIDSQTRTPNIVWHNEAFAAAMQKKFAVEKFRNGFAWKYAGAQLCGANNCRTDFAWTMDTTNA